MQKQVLKTTKKMERVSVCLCTIHQIFVYLLCVKHYARCQGPQNEPNIAFSSGNCQTSGDIDKEKESYMQCDKVPV